MIIRYVQVGDSTKVDVVLDGNETDQEIERVRVILGLPEPESEE